MLLLPLVEMPFVWSSDGESGFSRLGDVGDTLRGEDDEPVGEGNESGVKL